MSGSLPDTLGLKLTLLAAAVQEIEHANCHTCAASSPIRCACALPNLQRVAVNHRVAMQENIVVIAKYRTQIARLEEEIRLARGEVGPAPSAAAQVADTPAVLPEQADDTQAMDVSEGGSQLLEGGADTQSGGPAASTAGAEGDAPAEQWL